MGRRLEQRARLRLAGDGDARDSGIAAQDARGRSRFLAGDDDLERARGAESERLLHEVVAAAGRVALGHDLDRRHPRLEPERGQGGHDEQSGGRCSQATGRRQSRSAQRANAGDRCSPAHYPRQREPVDPRAELREHGRQE